MSTGQIVFALFLVGIICLAVYRGAVEPYMEKRKKRSK